MFLESSISHLLLQHTKLFVYAAAPADHSRDNEVLQMLKDLRLLRKYSPKYL